MTRRQRACLRKLRVGAGLIARNGVLPIYGIDRRQETRQRDLLLPGRVRPCERPAEDRLAGIPGYCRGAGRRDAGRRPGAPRPYPPQALRPRRRRVAVTTFALVVDPDTDAPRTARGGRARRRPPARGVVGLGLAVPRDGGPPLTGPASPGDKPAVPQSPAMIDVVAARHAAICAA